MTQPNSPQPSTPPDYHLDGILFVVYAINCALNVALSLIAALGNLTVLLALRRTATLHAPSKALLGGLALSDLSVGLMAQPVFVEYAVNSLRAHKLQVASHSILAISILGVFLSAVSLLTLTVISTDRVLAFRLKLRYRQQVTLTRVLFVLVGVWLVGGMTATLCYFYRAQGQLFALAFLLFCIAVTSFNYLTIYTAMHRQGKRVFTRVENATSSTVVNLNDAAAAAPRLATTGRSFRRSVRSALCVYVALLLCCLPYLCVAVASFLVGPSTVVIVCRHLSETVVYLNSSLNPLLYCWTSQDLRKAMWATLKSPCSAN